MCSHLFIHRGPGSSCLPLLTNPGSKHTIADDLESHFFVLMWTALHWVKHDKPGDRGIDMEHIFDQQRPLPGGVVKGGAGKEEMYRSKESDLRGVKFACGPFNGLFWDLWILFARYLIRKRDAALNGDQGSCEYLNET